METDNSKSLPAQPLWVGMWFPKASSGRVASEVVGSGFGTPGESASHHVKTEAPKPPEHAPKLLESTRLLPKPP